MSIKDKLPSSYLEFIEKYDKPFKIVDKKTSTTRQKVPGTNGTYVKGLRDK